MSWFQKLLPPKIKRKESGEKKVVPEGLWSKCAFCEAVLYCSDLGKISTSAPSAHHNRISAACTAGFVTGSRGPLRDRPGSAVARPLKFKDSKRYSDRLAEARSETDEEDALVVMQGSVKTLPSSRQRSNSGSWEDPWARWSANASCARSSVPRAAPAVRLFRRQRRGAHAGRPAVAHADGEDMGGDYAVVRRAAAFHLGTDGSDHGRRIGEFCLYRGRRDC